METPQIKKIVGGVVTLAAVTLSGKDQCHVTVDSNEEMGPSFGLTNLTTIEVAQTAFAAVTPENTVMELLTCANAAANKSTLPPQEN